MTGVSEAATGPSRIAGSAATVPGWPKWRLTIDPARRGRACARRPRSRRDPRSRTGHVEPDDDRIAGLVAAASTASGGVIVPSAVPDHRKNAPAWPVVRTRTSRHRRSRPASPAGRGSRSPGVVRVVRQLVSCVASRGPHDGLASAIALDEGGHRRVGVRQGGEHLLGEVEVAVGMERQRHPRVRRRSGRDEPGAPRRGRGRGRGRRASPRSPGRSRSGWLRPTGSATRRSARRDQGQRDATVRNERLERAASSGGRIIGIGDSHHDRSGRAYCRR